MLVNHVSASDDGFTDVKPMQSVKAWEEKSVLLVKIKM